MSPALSRAVTAAFCPEYRAQAGVVEELCGQRPVSDRCVRLGEGDRRRPDAQVEPLEQVGRVVLLDQAQRGQRCRALRVRRQLVDVNAAERQAQRLHPLRSVRREVGLVQPGDLGDRAGDFPRVERRRPLRRKPPERVPHLGQAIAAADSGRGEGRASERLGPLPERAHARRCGHPAERQIGSVAERLVEAQAAEALGEVEPGGDRARHGDRARAVAVDARPSRSCGERPEPFSPALSPSFHTMAKASPPTPLRFGSTTGSTAAAASAASTRCRRRARARRPACVASGWLVATIASAAIVGRRGKPERGSVSGLKSRSKSCLIRAWILTTAGSACPARRHTAVSRREWLVHGAANDRPVPFWTDVRVRFAETDAQGIAHHANYLVWFEVARVEYLDRFDGGYPGLQQRGVRGAHDRGARALRLARPASTTFSTIDVRCGELRGARFRYEYLVQPDGEPAAEAGPATPASTRTPSGRRASRLSGRGDRCRRERPTARGPSS